MGKKKTNSIIQEIFKDFFQVCKIRDNDKFVVINLLNLKLNNCSFYTHVNMRFTSWAFCDFWNHY